MQQLPDGVSCYKKTPIFNQTNIPKGLLKAHSTKAGTWGKIVILSGQLRYTIETSPEEVIELDSENYGVVEPEVLHRVAPIGDVSFLVEFYK